MITPFAPNKALKLIPRQIDCPVCGTKAGLTYFHPKEQEVAYACGTDYCPMLAIALAVPPDAQLEPGVPVPEDHEDVQSKGDAK